MESRDQKRRFPAPWTVERTSADAFVVRDANGTNLAWVYCRDDLHASGWTIATQHLTSDEARRIAKGISRLPKFMAQRQGFCPRGGGHQRWKASRPYHVALEDGYVRRHWDEIDALCRLNHIPFRPTGERIQQNGLWCVHEFANQLDAMMFWDQFKGRWLRGTEFVYPDRPAEMPQMKQLKDWTRFNGKWTR